MGIYDRDYSHADYRPPREPRMQFVMPSLPPVIKWLLIINGAVFILQMALRGFGPEDQLPPIEQWFSVYPDNAFYAVQLWRIVTYQFLHGDLLHIVFNMFVLFQFGPLIERMWGPRRFLIFYLSAGAAGGLVYTLLVVFKVLEVGYLVGASGGILGLLGAGAVLFPNLRVMLMMMIPMSLRTLAIVLVCMSTLMFLRGQNAGGEAAHLAGLAVGVGYVLWRPWLERVRFRGQETRRQRSVAQQRAFQAEVDRILEKVHNSGIQSLSRKEKATLKAATQREQNTRWG